MVSKHILLLCVGLFLLSSSNSPEKLICKTWKVEKITFDEKPGLFTAEQRQGIADQLIKNATFSFQKNGTYTVTTNDINTSGSWFFVPGKKGFHTESDGIKADFKIQQLEKTKLVFEGVVITNDKMRFSCIPAIGKR